MKIYIIAAALCAVAWAAKSNKEYAPPVAILKQIDKHNEDGSYSYGYEAADGTFKIETKYPNGEVYGKYGYVDDTGTLREVEYGASRRGFEPAGNEIQVAPPTINSNRDAIRPLRPEEEDDGQYREDPADYYKDDAYAQQPVQRPQAASRYRPESVYRRPEPVYSPEPEYEPFEPQITQPAYRPQSSYKPQSSYRPYYAEEAEPAPRSYYRPQPQPQPKPQPAYRPQSNFGFQNTNTDWNTNNYAPNWNSNPAPNWNSNPAPNWNSNPAPRWNNDPLWNSKSNWNAPPANGPSWQGHPAQNVDIWTGSYSVNYKR